jgi:hypothetical protein
MVNIPLAQSDYHRSVAKEARIRMRNRYYELNPVLTEGQVALIQRMGLRRLIYVGEGPIRAEYSQPGSFDDCVFVVSGQSIYRVDVDLTVTLITSDLVSPITGFVSMAATSRIGTTPEYLFIADGFGLYLYIADGYAQNTLVGTAANNDVVRIDLMYYKWTNGSVDAGTPDGTVANPWLVALGGDNTEAFENMQAAFGDNGIPGVQYSTALEENTVVQVQAYGSNSVRIRATEAGIIGNAIITTETGGAIAWDDGGTLAGGGDPSFTQVETPDDVAMISVGYIGSHVICVPAQGQGINGRFYWIEPGETTIDPLNFATAERAPDPVFQVIVFGDNFWLPGQTTTEVWYLTGDPNAPVLRQQGVTFDRGTWEGTAVQVKDSMLIVDSDGNVFQIEGGIKEVSRPDVAQRIRQAIQYQTEQTL